MKKYIYMLIVGCMIMAPATVYTQENGFIWPFADENHVYWCISGEPQYSVDVWIWSIHPIKGQVGAEFNIQYPSNVIPDTLTMNEAVIESSEGSLPGGIRINLNECQTDWVWLCKQRIHITDSYQTSISLSGHPETGLVRLSTCEEGYPYETCWTCTLFVNYTELMEECQPFEPYNFPCAEPVGVKGSTWGSIKSLYR